ncbi:MAG TPA: hypothetical protein VK155_08965 [Bacteroidales bacterium]|nr:hypothetical protein [Bacteroidales bacterium]
MKKSFLIILSIICFNGIIMSKTPVRGDRWLEMDLYWFEHENMEASVDRFWERFNPLMEGVEGWKGVILNVGWISDYILEWHGDQNELIRFPKNMEVGPFFKDYGQLGGNTIERMKKAEARFEATAPPQVVNYEKWTYSDLKKLSALLKRVALKKYQITEIKVGTFVLGFESIYGGEKTNFTKAHPNAFVLNYPNLVARLSADKSKYGAFPEGIPEGTSFPEFFGKQWGDFSKKLGIDVIVLRDSYMGVGIYDRKGPYGKTAPDDPQKVREWSEATAELVKQAKVSNPKALVIGYSNAASAVADLRVNCFDLESIANEGYLDGWIDQSWAGAWNEVGQRPNWFWNRPTLGWTYQLAYMLVHGAVLANSKVHHYFLTETFDAWESWDIIHNARERLRWGIWAYSHAAVKTPAGLKMPAGSYISWCNQGKELLSEEDVRFLAIETNNALEDAAETKKINGPTLVYCRSAMEWQSQNKPSVSIKEWIDEQAGTLMKWSIPVLSITRSEYLPGVESDMFIFQTPVHLEKDEKYNIIKILQSGKPAAVFASPVNGIDKDIANLLGVSSKDTIVSGTRFVGTLNYNSDGLYKSLPNTFPVFQPFSRNTFSNGLETVYSVENSPCLGKNVSGGKQLVFWDPPEFSINLVTGSGKYGGSLDQILGSTLPYFLTAGLINELFKGNDLPFAEELDQYHPLGISSWELKDGTLKILAANLEEGINHTDEHTAGVTINLEHYPGMDGKDIAGLWHSMRIPFRNHKLQFRLDQAQSELFSLSISQ